MMKEGKYTAKVIDCGLSDGKTAPQTWMKFKTDDGDITWYGSTSEKAIEYTIQALLLAGFQGTDFGDLHQGLASFNPKDVTISVKEETYNGKTSLKVKGVFAITSPKTFTGQAPKMSALFTAQRKELGLDKNNGLPF